MLRKNPYRNKSWFDCISVLEAAYDEAMLAPSYEFDGWDWDVVEEFFDDLEEQRLFRPKSMNPAHIENMNAKKLKSISRALRLRVVDKPRFYLSVHYATMRMKQLLLTRDSVPSLEQICREELRSYSVEPYEDFEAQAGGSDSFDIDEFEAQAWWDSLSINHKVEISPEDKEKIDNVTNTMKETLEAANRTLNNVSAVANSVKFSLEVLPTAILIITLILFCRGKPKKVWIPVIYLFGVPLFGYLTMKIGAQFSDNVKKRIHDVLYQSDFDEEVDGRIDESFYAEANNETPIVGLALLLTSLVTVHTVPKGKRSANFMKSIGDLPKLTDGLTTVSAFVIDLFVKCVNEIKIMVNGGDVDEWIVKTEPEIDAWCTSVREIAQEMHEGRLPMNLGSRDRARQLEIQGAKLTQKVFAGVEGIRVKNALTAYGKMLKKVQDAFDCFSPSKQFVRQEPYAITCAGSPGVGKSWIVSMLIADVLARVLPERDLPEFQRNPAQFMYHRFFEEEFWTDYQNQFCCVIDDFMQFRDTLGVPGEALEFVRMVNNAPHTLHMADLASKGKIQFTSKIIIVNTNQKNLEVASIVSKEALTRRMNCVLHVCPRKEYCTAATVNAEDPWNRVFDKDHPALKDENGVQKFNKDVYELIRVRYPDLRNRPDVFAEVGRYSYDEMINIICDEYQRNTQVADLYSGDFKSRISSSVEARLKNGTLYQAQAGDEEDKKNVEINIREFTFIKNRKAPVKIDPSDLELSDLDAIPESDEERMALTLDKVLPQHSYMWCLSDVREAMFFTATHFPKVWKSAGLLPPEDLTFGVRYIADVDKFVELFERLDDKVDRKIMEKFVLNHLLGGDLMSEPQWQIDVRSYFEDIRILAHNWLDQHPTLKQCLKYMGMIAAGAAIGFGMFKLYEMMTSRPEDGFIDESHPKNKRESRRPQRRPVKKLGEGNFVSEGGGDLNNHNLCKKITEKSLYILKFSDDRRLGNVFVYCGKKALIPYHYVTVLRSMVENDELQPDDDLVMRSNFQTESLPIKVKDILSARRTEKFVDKDLAVFLLPAHFHMHPNLIPHFASRELLGKHLDLNCTLIMPNNLSTENKPTYYWERLKAQYVTTKQSTCEGEIYDIQEVFTYAAKTDKGDCGSILTIDDASVLTKIIGMHVAGTRSSGIGLSVALCREDFEEVDKCFEKLGHRDFPPPEEVIMDAQADNSPAPGVFMPYFNTPKRLHAATVSKLRRSALYDKVFKSPNLPARLAPWKDEKGMWHNPMSEAIGRYGPACIADINPGVLKCCIDSLYSKLLSTQRDPKRHKPRVFSFEEAVLGLDGVKFCDSIPRATSAGYPYVMRPQPGYRGKEWFFGKDQTYDLDRPQCQVLKQECGEIYDYARKGIRTLHIYVDTLKDETLPIAKVLIGKTRLVSACPLHLTIVTRQLFLDFSMWIMENRIANFCAVGINPYSSEWHQLALMLKTKGLNVFAGDFAGYDTRQLAIVLTAICDMINRWYDDEPENQLARLTIFQEVTSSIHLSGDTVYQWSSKLPSGHPLTTILNSLQGLVLLLLCWCELNGSGVKRLEEFWDNVYPMVYGDDNIVNVSDRACDFFNLRTISVVMTKFNQVYTNEDKSAENYEYKSLESCTFLKRGFLFQERIRRYVAPLALSSILDMLNWYMESPERIKTQKDNVQLVLKELSLHDAFGFHVLRQHILSESRECLQYEPPIIEYEQLQDIVLDSELVW